MAHNLGDAVIQSRFIRLLSAAGYARNYLVWTRPQVAFLFDDIPNCHLVCSQFPIGTDKQFGVRSVLPFAKAVVKIRELNPSVTIDLIGDARDRWFARIAGSRHHVYPGWAPGHPFARLIRNPFGTKTAAMVVPATLTSVYDAHQMLLQRLVSGATSAGPAPAHTPWHLARPAKAMHVGLHPFASQKCKLWPDENWRLLAEKLLQDESVQITAFGSPAERDVLERLFAPLIPRVGLVTTSLVEFARRTSELDVMIGLDSFSVHMAERQGVRSVLINAGNPAGLWSTPGGTTLAGSGGCNYYPCFNIPKCAGTDFENACVKSVSVDDVLGAILR